MRTWIAFFTVECKRTGKLLLKSLGSFSACLLLTAAMVVLLSVAMQNAQVFQKVGIGVVIPEDESISRLAVQYISSMDSVQSVCDFYYLDEETAVEQLKQGSLQAVVVLPEGFYHDVQVGINPPAQIYLPKDPALNTSVFEELLTAGVSFLQTAEAGVYAALDTASYYGVEVENAGLGDTIARLFANQLLNREHIYSEKTLSPLGDLSVVEYYYAAGLVILLMMCGIQFGFLYNRKKRAVEDKLKICGVGRVRQAAVKVLVMTMFLYVTGLLYYFAGIAISNGIGIYFVSYQGEIWCTLLLLCLGIAAYFHVLYEMAGSSSQAAVFVFAVNVITILGAGVLIPEAYLGKGINAISNLLPMKYWNRYAAEILESGLSGETMLIMVGFLVGEILLGVLIGVCLGKSRYLKNRGEVNIEADMSRPENKRSICSNKALYSKHTIYYVLQLKLWLKSRGCWLQILFLVLILLVVGSIHVPDQGNTKIGFAGVNSEIAQTITERLSQKNDLYQYIVYENSEELEQEVEEGQLECGFIFGDGFEEQWTEDLVENSLTYVCTPFTTKGLAARETVYGAVLELYGERLLSQNVETITGESSEEASEMLAGRYETYLNSNAVFQTDVTYVETDTTLQSISGDADNATSLASHLRGVVACMLFLTIYLAGAAAKEEKNLRFLSQLEKSKRHRFECAGMLAAATPMLLEVFLLFVGKMTEGYWNSSNVVATGSVIMKIGIEFVKLILLVVASMLFTAVTMGIFKKDTGMLSALPALLLLQIVICPVFYDFTSYVPAVKYIRYLCPVMYYL